jgi:hypothetical protein
VVVTTLAALSLAAGATPAFAETYQPTFTIYRDCSLYGDPRWDGAKQAIGVLLSGFPPQTTFSGAVETPDGGTPIESGPITMGDEGIWGFSPLRALDAGTWSAHGETTYGPFEASLYVDCAEPSQPAFATYVFPAFTVGDDDAPDTPPRDDGADQPEAAPRGPALQVVDPRIPKRVSGLIDHGAGGVVSCDGPCVVRATLVLGGSAARRMGVDGRAGQAKVRLGSNERGRVVAYPRRGVARRLLHPTADGDLRLGLRFSATTPGDGPTTRSASWTVREQLRG